MAGGDIKLDYDNLEAIEVQSSQLIEQLEYINSKVKRIEECNSTFFNSYKSRLNEELYPTIKEDINSLYKLNEGIKAINSLRETDDNIKTVMEAVAEVNSNEN